MPDGTFSGVYINTFSVIDNRETDSLPPPSPVMPVHTSLAEHTPEAISRIPYSDWPESPCPPTFIIPKSHIFELIVRFIGAASHPDFGLGQTLDRLQKPLGVYSPR